MTLTVVEGRGSAVRASSPVLRLGVPPQPGDQPPSTAACARRAIALLTKTYPEWLWRWVRDHGVLDLRIYEGPVSWWWYSPLSEMSPLRSRFIREVYWLMFVREVVAEHHITEIDWIGDDRTLADAAASMLGGLGVTVTTTITRRDWPGPVARAAAIRVLFVLRHLLQWCLLRPFRNGPECQDASIAFFSRYPVLWERTGAGRQERMFGGVPDRLTRDGRRICYLAAFAGDWRQLMRPGRLKQELRADRVVLVESYASLWDCLSAYADWTGCLRYCRWIRQPAHAELAGIDVTALLRRAMHINALSAEIPFDRILAKSIAKCLAHHPRVETVCLPFEFQPMERAVSLGVASRRVIGFQTGIYTSTQMGLGFSRDQVRVHADDAERAPLPDVILAYGDLPYRILVERARGTRVEKIGPLRYSELASARHRNGTATPAHRPPKVLVAGSSDADETDFILRAVFDVCGNGADLHLLVKFHYHADLGSRLRTLGQRFPGVNYTVHDSKLHDLIRSSAAVVCGGSSVSFEAMALGRMPLVFRLASDVLPDPTRDVDAAVIAWDSAEALAKGLDAVLSGAGDPMTETLWSDALREQMSPLDDSMYEGIAAVFADGSR